MPVISMNTYGKNRSRKRIGDKFGVDFISARLSVCIGNIRNFQSLADKFNIQRLAFRSVRSKNRFYFGRILFVEKFFFAYRKICVII